MTRVGFTGGTAAVLWWQLVARSPSGMLTIALLVWGQAQFGSYGLAGAIVAGYSVGFALGAPLSARLLGVVGTTPVLLVTAVISGGALAGIAVTHPPLPAAVGLAAIAGLAFPPVTPLARSIYSRRVPPARLEGVYALDAVAQEFIWVLGPLLATLVAASLGPRAAIAVCAGVLVTGSSVFAFLRLTRASQQVSRLTRARDDRPTAAPPSPDSADQPAERPRNRSRFVLVVLIAVGFFLVGAGALVEVLVVSSFGYEHAATGLLLAVVALGSLVGGLTIGRRPVRARTLTMRLFIVVAGMSAAATLVHLPVWLAVPLFVSGLGVAPAFAAIHTIIARGIPARQRTEAYALTHSGQLVGMAAGTAIGGLLVESTTAPVVLLIATGSAFAAASLALLTARR